MVVWRLRRCSVFRSFWSFTRIHVLPKDPNWPPTRYSAAHQETTSTPAHTQDLQFVRKRVYYTSEAEKRFRTQSRVDDETPTRGHGSTVVQDANAPYDEYLDKNRKDPPTKATHTKREDNNTHNNAVKTKPGFQATHRRSDEGYATYNQNRSRSQPRPNGNVRTSSNANRDEDKSSDIDRKSRTMSALSYARDDEWAKSQNMACYDKTSQKKNNTSG